MYIIHLLALLAQKALSFTVGAAFLSATIVAAVYPKSQPAKIIKEKKILQSPPHVHEGINDYIVVTGWDGSSYRATVEFNYHKDTNGGYTIAQPEFFLVQVNSGNPLVYPTLNIIDANNDKIKYTCEATATNSKNGDVDFKFTCSATDAVEDHIDFTAPDGENWRAYVDSTYNHISDTNALLRFRVEKGSAKITSRI